MGNMLMPTPETPWIRDKINRFTIDRLTLVQRWPAIRRGLGKAGVVLTGLSSIYATDVAIHQTMQETAHVDIAVLGEAQAPENNDSALVFLNGWGTNDAIDLTNSLGSRVQDVVDGQLWSIDYNEATLNPVSIAHEIEDFAEAHDVDRISVIGSSMGGITALEAVENIVKTSDLEVELIALRSMPDGTEGLQDWRQDQMGILDTISAIPGAEYSSLAIPFVNSYFNNDNHPGMWLMADQSLAIANADVEKTIANIAEEAKPGQHPVLWYLGIEAPRDDTVNNELSSENVCHYAGKVALECFIDFVPGGEHSHPWVAVKSYGEVMSARAPEIQHAIAEQHAQKTLDDVGLFDFLDLTSSLTVESPAVHPATSSESF